MFALQLFFFYVRSHAYVVSACVFDAYVGVCVAGKNNGLGASTLTVSATHAYITQELLVCRVRAHGCMS